MKILSLFILIYSIDAISKEFTESMVVNSYSLDNNTGFYRLNIKNKAGVYLASRNYLECLDFSIKHKKAVKIVFDVSSLKLMGCEIEKESKTQKTSK